MTIITTFYTMDGKEGVDLNFSQTSISVTTAPEVPAPRAKLGDRVQGNAGSEWMFVQASATATCFNVVAIDSNFQARNVTSALMASNVYTYGVVELQPNQFGAAVSVGNANGGVVNVSDYFWAAMKVNGGAVVNVISTAALGAKLYVSSTAGVLTSSAQSEQLTGIAIVGSVLATSTVVTPIEYLQYGYLVPYVSV